MIDVGLPNLSCTLARREHSWRVPRSEFSASSLLRLPLRLRRPVVRAGLISSRSADETTEAEPKNSFNVGMKLHSLVISRAFRNGFARLIP